MAGKACCAAWKCEPGDRIAKPQREGEAVLRGAKV